jgi:hypothetical protein
MGTIILFIIIGISLATVIGIIIYGRVQEKIEKERNEKIDIFLNSYKKQYEKSEPNNQVPKDH